MNYLARFTLDKTTYSVGEPIFCVFTIQNTGSRAFTFAYRSPNRALSRELEQEPQFHVTGEHGELLPDPAPKPCGGVAGSVLYGSVTLPPGHGHAERWLLNQWARLSKPGTYHVRAERRLPLLAGNFPGGAAVAKPDAFALAINELTFEVVSASEADLRASLEPYLKSLEDAKDTNFDEAVLVVTTIPQSFLLTQLEGLLTRNRPDRPFDHRQVLEGLARLDTPPAWKVILEVARGRFRPSDALARRPNVPAGDSLQTYAIQLLGEKADPSFLPAILEIASNAPEEARGEALRALGFFNDPRANQVLFEKLHSTQALDRVNAILGLKNLESRDAFPALLAMLDDPEARVRQVAHFALQSLTGVKFYFPPSASRAETARVRARWHAWWQEKGANFSPLRQPPCQDW